MLAILDFLIADVRKYKAGYYDYNLTKYMFERETSAVASRSEKTYDE